MIDLLGLPDWAIERIRAIEELVPFRQSGSVSEWLYQAYKEGLVTETEMMSIRQAIELA